MSFEQYRNIREEQLVQKGKKIIILENWEQYQEVDQEHHEIGTVLEHKVDQEHHEIGTVLRT